VYIFKTVRRYKSMKTIRIRAVADVVTHQAMTPIEIRVNILRTMKNQ
jgi:hypothetical protein